MIERRKVIPVGLATVAGMHYRDSSEMVRPYECVIKRSDNWQNLLRDLKEFGQLSAEEMSRLYIQNRK